MGKLGDLKRSEEDLVSLLPFRILDLLSRDLNDQESHIKGLNMLENLIIKKVVWKVKVSQNPATISIKKNLKFSSKLNPFLTVQEQIDLFVELQKGGSIEAGFLCIFNCY